MFDGEVVVREIVLPDGVHGVLREDPDGLANIYINLVDPEEEKRKTLDHELRHYRLGHLYSNKTLRQIEKEAETDDSKNQLRHRVRGN